MQAPTPHDVLVVDDDADVRFVLAEAIEHLGYRTLQAKNGRVALELLAAAPVRMVLLDLVMPEMDGWQFREAQRGNPALAHVPVVVLTALSGWRSRPDLVALPPEDFLTKPICLTRLQAVVARHCAPPR